jgi:hypothetical protein
MQIREVGLEVRLLLMPGDDSMTAIISADPQASTESATEVVDGAHILRHLLVFGGIAPDHEVGKGAKAIMSSAKRGRAPT